MTKVRVAAFGLSLDGYGAGPDQSLRKPDGRRRRWRCTNGCSRPAPSARCRARRAATTGVDDDFATRGFDNVGAWILGRNMFGPVRGPWPDDELEGLVGRQPALSRARSSSSPITRGRRSRWRAARPSTSSPTASRRRSTAPARRPAGRDVRIGGGVATIRQYLEARLIDELHLAVAPVLLGARRASVRRPRPAGARLSGRRACRLGGGDACGAAEGQVVAPPSPGSGRLPHSSSSGGGCSQLAIRTGRRRA